MLGPVIIVIVCCIAVPVAVLVSGGFLAALIGWLVQEEVKRNHEGSELIELNR
ncbi:MAG: hypothetical protein JWM05_787 [Acidimicrobiales bacterium]|nr:hypothetical protein [Acidimicrobiales bacterium]